MTEEWADGAKSNKAKEEKEAKKRAEAARKAENARLLAEEEAAAPAKVKAAPKAGGQAKKASASVAGKKKAKEKPAGPGAIAATGGLASVTSEEDMDKVVESFQATGIDDALELLEVINAKTDKASVGQQAAGLERHPERRFKVRITHE